MADIEIVRAHTLGLAEARKLALRWAEVARQKLDMECTYAEGKAADLVSFKRPGASGELKVTEDRFQLHARLGLLMGVFRSRIEAEIVKNLDQLLAQDEPLAAFEQGLEKHDARRAAKHPEHRKPVAKPAARAAAVKKAK